MTEQKPSIEYVETLPSTHKGSRKFDAVVKQFSESGQQNAKISGTTKGSIVSIKNSIKVLNLTDTIKVVSRSGEFYLTRIVATEEKKKKSKK